MAGPERDPRIEDALGYLQRLVDHEVSSVGVAAGVIDGLSLDGPRRVLEALGDPHRSYRVVHVTGTNGKGTVCRLVEALVGAVGLRVGAYLSPEGTVQERIRVDGRPIDDAALADVIESVRGAAVHLDVALTAFEAVTLAALVALADAPVDVAVVEVGLLGRYDATNVVDADVAVVTTVGGDHTDFAPGWRDRVAHEKAGIIESGHAAVLGAIDDDLVAHFAAEGPEPLVRFGHDFDCVDNRLAVGGRRLEVVTSRGNRLELLVPLHGAHQGANVAVAVEAVEQVLHTELAADVVEAAFERVVVPGRLEVLGHGPLVVLDGAHNADAATAVGEALAESFVVAGRRTAVVGTLVGRDPVAFLDALHRAYPLDLVVAVPLAPPRGFPGEAVAAAAESLGIAARVARDVGAGVRDALEGSDDDDVVVVTGSFRLVDEARMAWRRWGRSHG